jgi:hypothetical protein
MFKSIRILLAIAAFHDYEIWQMDVKTAFLNGNIDEDLYMMQPEGFVNPKDANKVCKLQRSIYGLKQASRSWKLHFDQVIWINVIQRGFGPIFHGDQTDSKINQSLSRLDLLHELQNRFLRISKQNQRYWCPPTCDLFPVYSQLENSTPLTLVRTPLAL